MKESLQIVSWFFGYLKHYGGLKSDAKNRCNLAFLRGCATHAPK